MAQPNVAREPSMEEILASIRKIIENNEPPEAEGVAVPSHDFEDDADSIHLTVEGNIKSFEDPEEETVEAFNAPEPVAAPDVSVMSDGAKPTSLADVAARVRAAAERGPTIAQPTARAFGDETEKNVPPAPRAEVAAEPVRTEAPAFPAPRSAPAGASPVAASAPVSIAVPPAAPSQSLVSAQTGERVARSFDELAEALGSSKRSLDEVAEEMLRPMLQQWLDDNLPTLVERLVREEIERVARGPRRGA